MKQFRIIIAGGRNRHVPSDIYQIKIVVNGIFNTYGPKNVNITIVQGGCPTGIDELARSYAEEEGLEIETHEADWSKGRSAGPIRNHVMAALGADLCLAFPGADSPGTKSMIREAERAGIPTRVFPIES